MMKQIVGRVPIAFVLMAVVTVAVMVGTVFAAEADKAKVPFPSLKDVGNKYADLVDAKRTPEMFVLDMDHKLAYHGAFDNRKDPAKAGPDNYVRNAVDSLLAGKPVDPAEVNGWGCSIKRVPKPREGS